MEHLSANSRLASQSLICTNHYLDALFIRFTRKSLYTSQSLCTICLHLAFTQAWPPCRCAYSFSPRTAKWRSDKIHRLGNDKGGNRVKKTWEKKESPSNSDNLVSETVIFFYQQVETPTSLHL